MDIITSRNLRDFDEKGFFIAGQKVSGEWLDKLTKECEKYNADNPKWFQRNPHLKSDLFAEFVKQPIFVEACKKLVGPNVDLHWNLIAHKPPFQGKEFHWHQDAQYGLTEPENYITCWVALDVVTIGNGCLWVIPGSHKWGRLDHVFLRETETFYAGRFAQDVDDKNQVPIEMYAGEIAIFHSHVLHRSGSNSSDKLRRSYICAYHHCNLTYLTDTGMKGAEFPILRKNKVVGS